MIQVLICDDHQIVRQGIKQILADAADSWGVIGMRERAGHFGGKLTVDSAPGLGTRVRLVMPLHDMPLEDGSA